MDDQPDVARRWLYGVGGCRALREGNRQHDPPVQPPCRSHGQPRLVVTTSDDGTVIPANEHQHAHGRYLLPAVPMDVGGPSTPTPPPERRPPHTPATPTEQPPGNTSQIPDSALHPDRAALRLGVAARGFRSPWPGHGGTTRRRIRRAAAGPYRRTTTTQAAIMPKVDLRPGATHSSSMAARFLNPTRLGGHGARTTMSALRDHLPAAIPTVSAVDHLAPPLPPLVTSHIAVDHLK